MNNRILVTGDSRGLGLTICKRLLEKGHWVVGCSRSFSDESKKLHEKYPDKYTHITYDLSDPTGIKSFYLESLKPLGPFSGFVNNAAHAYDDLCTNANCNSLEHMMKINVLSPIMLTKYMIRDMLLHRIEGSLIHISSISVHTGYKGLSMYAASKGAIEAFSKNIAREWGEKRIRSNVVCPGFMETEMSSSLDTSLRNKIYSRTSLKVPTSLISVSDTVEFLLGEGACSITGQTLNVDSGTI
jgi:3-oxoacyl-[acyl-carrier protein] reductase